MLYYVLGIVMVVFFASANIRYGKHTIQDKKKENLTIEKFVLFVMFAFYVFLFTFESVNSNTDLQAYRDAYLSFQYVFDGDYLSIIRDNKDPVYYIVSFFFYRLGLGFYGWHAIIGLFYSYALYDLIKRYSSNVYISFIVSISLGSLAFALSALRQILAISFVIFAFRYIVEKRPIKFIALTLIASLFHSTAIIFLVAYLLYWIKLKIKKLIVMAIFMIIAIPVAKPLVAFILPRIGAHELYYEYLQSETSLQISGTIISASILVFCVVCMLLNKKEAKYQGLCNFAMLSIFFRVLSVVFFAEMFRFSLYFSIFDIILIAEACSCGVAKDRTIIKIKTLLATLALTAYYFISPATNIVDYVFK